MYFVAFTVLMIFSRNIKSLGIILKSRTWFSNIIVGPVIIMLSLLTMYVISLGDFTFWGFQGLDVFEFGVFVTSGGLIAVFTVGIAEIFSPTPAEMKPPENSKERILFFFLIVILASISEEILFRGFLQGFVDSSYLLSIDFGMVVITSGAIISAIIFAIIHTMPAKQMGMNPRVLVGSSLILGITAGIALATTGSLIAPIIIHAEFNLDGFLESIYPTRKRTESMLIE